MAKIYTINNKKEEKFLRQKTPIFDFSKFNRKEINNLVKTMREMMKGADGIGLSANQLGLPFRFFVAQAPMMNTNKKSEFYAIFNPQITKFSEDILLMEEGCLSVPKIFGEVARPEKIVIEGFDKNGRIIKIKTRGILGRIFQHECDHLNGILFIDKAKKVYKINS